MPQGSHIIDGSQNGGLYTTALNAALVALLTQNSGASAPAPSGQPLAFQLWADTTTGVLKMRTSGNDAWVVLGPLAGLAANALQRNLVAKVVDGTLGSVPVTADALTIGGTYIASFTATLTTAASPGANAIDTGSWATNTWYALHAICNEDKTLSGLLASLSATAPTMPTGYTRARRIGYVRSTGTATNLRQFTQAGPHVLYDMDDDFTPLNGAQDTTFTDVNLANYVPPGIVRAFIAVVLDGNGVSGIQNMQARINGGTVTTGYRLATIKGDTAMAATAWVDLDSGRIFEYKLSSATPKAYVSARGWWDPALA